MPRPISGSKSNFHNCWEYARHVSTAGFMLICGLCNQPVELPAPNVAYDQAALFYHIKDDRQDSYDPEYQQPPRDSDFAAATATAPILPGVNFITDTPNWPSATGTIR